MRSPFQPSLPVTTLVILLGIATRSAQACGLV